MMKTETDGLQAGTLCPLRAANGTKVNHSPLLSRVEKAALSLSSYDAIYPPAERMAAIVVPHFPLMGKLAAMRFLEWVQENPEGVISLPTGKTPEYFIKWVGRLLKGWDTREVRAELEKWGLAADRRPDMRGLHFVQIDEFYPIDSAQTNSFSHYVKTYYLKGFGLDAARALLIDPCQIGVSGVEPLRATWADQPVDLTLRYRHPKTALERRQKLLLERVDQWCMEYEERIERLGGIGFFLGGIGPDGHIGFNIRGSDHHSTTRLCPINYETQAAAATDLGGIEIARRCHVITIGLKTITRNPDCTAIIMAAGQAKARIVADAIQSDPDVNVPASALQVLPNARFYLTEGAAGGLVERQYQALCRVERFDEAQAEQILVDLAARKGKGLLTLEPQDAEDDRFAGRLLQVREGRPLSQLARQAAERIEKKIARGMEVLEHTRFLHTEPHHDDVMLGYFAHLARHFRRADNHHYFLTLTSGFTSVTNEFMVRNVENARQFMATAGFRGLFREGYFDPADLMARNRDVWQYLDGVAAAGEGMKNEGCARRFLRNVIETYRLESADAIEKSLGQLERYFATQYPGAQDPKDIQQLKGMCREWEAECLWGYYGWNCDNVAHLRLGFYTGDIFTPQPTRKHDVMPILRHLEAVRPDVITVALDPEASGPDTHYKVLQAIAEALRIYQKQSGRTDIRIWGYRNVWYRFNVSEADICVPVSLNMFSIMHQSFENAFLSQKTASFPSHEHDGPFSELAQRIQVQQYQQLKTCLGRQWFYDHPSPLIRATRGFVFLKEMRPEEFYTSCRQLRKSIEDYS